MAKKKSGAGLSDAGRALGKRGGPARAKALTVGRRRSIASQGGKAKAKTKTKK